jgi:hypothetical protein
MADFFKGLAGGMQTGLQFGQQLRQRRLEDELAQVYAKPEEFVDYTPEQQRQIQGLQAAGGYDVQAVPGAEGQAPTLRYSARPGSMYYDDMGQPEAPTEVAPQRVQRYGGQTVAGQFDPAQLRGLQMREAARVLGASGDVRGAAALEAQAEDFTTRAEDRATQARFRLLQEKQMERQGLLTEGQIAEMNRNQARTKKLDDVDADVAQWQSSRLLDPNTNEPRQPTMDDNIAALQYRATALQKAGLNKEATDSLRDYQGFAVNQIKLDETQRNSQLGAVAAAIAAGDLGPAAAFYDRYVLDGAKVTGMKTDPKTGAVTVSRVRDDGEPMPDKVIKGGANELLAALNSFKDPMALYNYSQNEFKNNLDLRKTVATEQTAKSTIGLNAAKTAQTTAQTKILNMNLEGNEKARELQTALANLDEADPMFATKQSNLIAQFNALNAAPGKSIPMGGAGGKKGGSVLQTPVDLKKNDDGTYTAFSKDGGRALYNTFNGEELPLGMEVDTYRGMKEAAKKNGVGPVTGEDNGRLVLKFVGPDGKFYDDAEKAKYAKPAPAKKEAAAEDKKAGLTTSRTSGEKNPFVDASGKALPNAPQGAPAAGVGLVKGAAEAVEANVGTAAAATRYIQGKLDRGETLSSTERARAIQLGLINR